MRKKTKPTKENINYDIENHEIFVKERREKGKLFYASMKRDKLVRFCKGADRDLWTEDIWEVEQ